MEIVDPPTRERIEEKSGTDSATKRTATIMKVRVTMRFHEKAVNGQKIKIKRLI